MNRRRKRGRRTPGGSCRHCGGKLLYENIAGVRVFREIDGKKVFKKRCADCRQEHVETRSAN